MLSKGKLLRTVMLLIVMVLPAGCRTLPPILTDSGIYLQDHDEIGGDLRWPPPPAEARIRYAGSFDGPMKLGIRTPFLKRTWGALTGNRTLTTFVKPFGIALEIDLLAVTDPGAHAVWIFDLKARSYRRLTAVSALPLAHPLCVALHSGTLYVTDPEAGRLLALSRTGELLFTIEDPLSRPTGVCISHKRIYVADSALHKLFIFDLKGKLLEEIGQRGDTPGSFNFPSFVYATGTEILVTDTMNHRVQRLTPGGMAIGTVASIGQTSGHLSRPKGVASDLAGNIYIADAMFDNIQIFNRTAQFLLAFGETGSTSGQFWMPAGVSVTAKGDILVADCYNMRIQLFQLVNQKREASP